MKNKRAAGSNASLFGEERDLKGENGESDGIASERVRGEYAETDCASVTISMPEVCSGAESEAKGETKEKEHTCACSFFGSL